MPYRTNASVVVVAIWLSRLIAQKSIPKLNYSELLNDLGKNKVLDGGKSTDLKVRNFLLSLFGLKESALALVVIVSLVLRSYFDLKLVQMSTLIESCIISRKSSNFWSSLKELCWYIVPLSGLISINNYALSELAISIRNKITIRFFNQFTKNKTFYQAVHLNQLKELNENMTDIKTFTNIDQILTQDVQTFTLALTNLFSHVLRPSIDVIVNTQKLISSTGIFAPASVGVYFLATSGILNWVRSPGGKFADGEQRLEGELRHVVARVVSLSEQIAALNGGEKEKSLLFRSLNTLTSYSRSYAQFRCVMSFIDTQVARYWLMVLSWVLVGSYFLVGDDKNLLGNEVNRDQLYRDYRNMSKMMLTMCNSVGSLIISGKDVVKVHALGRKIANFEETLDKLNNLHEALVKNQLESDSLDYPRNCVIAEAIDLSICCECEKAQKDVTRNSIIPMVSVVTSQCQCCGVDLSSIEEKQDFPYSAMRNKDWFLEIKDLTVAAPNGPKLLSDLNLRIERGMHTMVTGGNGAGKSSFLRVLAGVWPPLHGQVQLKKKLESQKLEEYYCESSSCKHGSAGRVNRQRIMYLPQKPYMTLGTLRDQIIYPHMLEDALNMIRDCEFENKAKNKACKENEIEFARLDQQLIKILHEVHLEYLLKPEEIQKSDKKSTNDEKEIKSDQLDERINYANSYDNLVIKEESNRNCLGLDGKTDWSSALSGGELQRLSFARLLYHKPIFALLDESSSAVSSGVELELYKASLKVDVTLITVSHREYLRQFHQYNLHLIKGDNYSFTSFCDGLQYSQYTL